MRTLTVDEIGFVSGGIQEAVISAPRIDPGKIVISDPFAIMDFIDQMDSQSGRSGGARGGPWWVVAAALVADEAKDLLEEYVKERTGYENLRELLKDALDDALRCGHPAGHAGSPVYYDPLPGCPGGDP
jgi:hypothetical protein